MSMLMFLSVMKGSVVIFGSYAQRWSFSALGHSVSDIPHALYTHKLTVTTIYSSSPHSAEFVYSSSRLVVMDLEHKHSQSTVYVLKL